MKTWDCQSCGACCCNTARNRQADTQEYIEVLRTDRLYRDRRELLRQVGTRNADGVWHLRLVGEQQHCVVLDGEVGDAVACGIYAYRPTGCRRVEAGDEECRNARRLMGIR